MGVLGRCGAKSRCFLVSQHSPWLLKQGGLDLVPFLRHRRIPEKPTKATPVHPPPAISTLNGPPMRPSQAPSASSSCQNFVVVRNKGLKSKIPVSAGFLAVQGRLLSGEFPRKSPEIRLFHRADASQGCALACIQRAGRTVTIVARTVGSKLASLGVDLPCRYRDIGAIS